MTKMASQITSLAVVYSTVYLDADQRKHQSSASLAFLWGIHRDRWIPRTKGQLCGKMFLFDDVIMPNRVSDCHSEWHHAFINGQCLVIVNNTRHDDNNETDNKNANIILMIVLLTITLTKIMLMIMTLIIFMMKIMMRIMLIMMKLATIRNDM